MSLSSFIAGLGDNQNFLAFNAHWGFAFFLMTLAAHFHVALIPVALVLSGIACVKEFWFDVKYETNPPQNYWDGLGDWAGYALGIALAFLI
jgi:hypothetical protein